jgi:hypothetical protein
MTIKCDVLDSKALQFGESSRFERSCRLSFQYRRVSEARIKKKQAESGYLNLPCVSAGVVLGLLFSPEHGRNIFFRNVRLSPYGHSVATQEIHSQHSYILVECPSELH